MDFLNEIVYAIIGVAVPIATTYLCKWLQSLYENNKNKIKNEKINATLGQVTEMITAAVEVTTSTYVKNLKKEDLFTAEAQKEAFNKTYNTVKQQLTADASVIIEQVYGDTETYITNKIEQLVEEMKK